MEFWQQSLNQSLLHRDQATMILSNYLLLIFVNEVSISLQSVTKISLSWSSFSTSSQIVFSSSSAYGVDGQQRQHEHCTQEPPPILPTASPPSMFFAPSHSTVFSHHRCRSMPTYHINLIRCINRERHCSIIQARSAVWKVAKMAGSKLLAGREVWPLAIHPCQPHACHPIQ